MVVCTFGAGPAFLYTVYALVGYCILGPVAVMLFPGCVCIGAYLVGPVCIAYGTFIKLFAAAVPLAAAAASATVSVDAGGSSSPTFWAATWAAVKVPVMSDIENRGV